MGIPPLFQAVQCTDRQLHYLSLGTPGLDYTQGRRREMSAKGLAAAEDPTSQAYAAWSSFGSHGHHSRQLQATHLRGGDSVWASGSERPPLPPNTCSQDALNSASYPGRGGHSLSGAFPRIRIFLPMQTSQTFSEPFWLASSAFPVENFWVTAA